MFRWIHHLPIGQKFLVLSLVALVMAAAPTAVVLHTSWGLYAVLKSEQAGLAPAKSLLQLVRLTQEHRGLSSAVLSGDPSKAADRQARAHSTKVEFFTVAREAGADDEGDES